MRRGGWRKRAGEGDGWGGWVCLKPSDFYYLLFKKTNGIMAKKGLEFCQVCRRYAVN